MSLKQTICFIALAGGLAGLLCWSLVIWIPGSFHFSQESSWLVDLINLTILRGLIGGFTVGFADHWSGDRVLAWVLSRVVVGLVSGGMSGIIQAGVRLAGLTIVALIASAFLDGCRAVWIGLGTGLRWITLDGQRAVDALMGGTAGGALGGTVFAALGSGITDRRDRKDFFNGCPIS